MFVYRIEKSDGTGPYQGEKDIGKDIQWYWWQEKNHAFDNTTPLPYEDLEFMIRRKTYQVPKNMIFGFESMEHFRRWFTELEILNLLDVGYIVYQYKVKEKGIRKGKKQLGFFITAVVTKEKIKEEEIL